MEEDGEEVGIAQSRGAGEAQGGTNSKTQSKAFKKAMRHLEPQAWGPSDSNPQGALDRAYLLLQ